MSDKAEPATRSAWLRRRLPRGVRLRLTLLYTLLFVAGGAALLAITYGLVSNSLDSGSNGATSRVAPSQQFIKECKAKLNVPHAPPGDSKARAAGAAARLSCEKAFIEGALAAQTAQRNYTMSELLTWSIVGLAGLTVASAGLGWVMAGRVLRPVHDITEAARRASERHLGERINMRGPDDELKELADTFDDMLERLDAAFAAQRQFVSNASHELRTPLTSMRTAIDRAERIIDALLTLAVSNQGIGTLEELDLATAAEDAVDAMEDKAWVLGLTVNTELQPAEVTGSRVLLERMVSNLVENAVVHNVVDGWVRVRVGSNNGHSYIEVANSGPVVNEEELPHLFEPFRRADARIGTSGVGLGLSIVQSVGEAHGATVKAEVSAGGGLVITVTLPSRQGRPG